MLDLIHTISVTESDFEPPHLRHQFGIEWLAGHGTALLNVLARQHQLVVCLEAVFCVLVQFDVFAKCVGAVIATEIDLATFVLDVRINQSRFFAVDDTLDPGQVLCVGCRCRQYADHATRQQRPNERRSWLVNRIHGILFGETAMVSNLSTG